MKILIITLLLSSCANFGGTRTITLDNALKECKFFGVKVRDIPETMPELTVNIVGKDIGYHCGFRKVACLKNGRDIYLESKDWMAQGEETCHAIDKEAKHTKKKKKIPIANGKHQNFAISYIARVKKIGSSH